MLALGGACESGVPNHTHVPCKYSSIPRRCYQHSKYWAEATCQLPFMGESTVQSSFHKICKHFAEELYDDHIYLPTGAGQDKVMEAYHKLGLTEGDRLDGRHSRPLGLLYPLSLT